MPIPTDPVKRVCYTDDLTVWASGVNIPDLEVSINNYIASVFCYKHLSTILENSLFCPSTLGRDGSCYHKNCYLQCSYICVKCHNKNNTISLHLVLRCKTSCFSKWWIGVCNRTPTIEEITAYLKDNSLLISAPKSSVTLITPDTHQAKIHPRIFIENSHLPLVKCPRILGVYLDPSLSFNKHSQYVAEKVSGRNNNIKALAGTSWGQQKETLLMTYKAIGRSIINYAAPVWSPNLHDINYRKIQYTQNEALRIATGCHKMSSIDHLHTEAEMLRVKEHSELRSAQYLARCLEPGNVCHPITTRAIPERQMKETLYTRHRNTVEPMMVKNDRKATLQALHTAAVVKAVQCHERNVVLDGRPPPISNSEKELTRKERSTLAQLRSGYCRLLGSYMSSMMSSISSSFARLTRLH